MPPSGTNSQAEAHPSPLPLFRPEALAAQEKMHGEPLLIRPFSLLLLGWTGIMIGVTVLGLLLACRYTEKAYVTGVLLSDQAVVSDDLAPATTVSSTPAGPKLQALFSVPAPWKQFLEPGARVGVRCRSCSDPGRWLAGTVTQISAEAPGPESRFRVTVALPSGTSISQLLPQSRVTQPPAKPDSAQSTIKVEAEIQLGRRSVIHLLVARKEAALNEASLTHQPTPKSLPGRP